MPVTQRDIAREVGVSQAVVSDVLGARPSGRVRPETRRRILEVADRLSYRPNASAVALRSRCSHQICYLVIGDEANRFGLLSEGVLTGLAADLSEHGYRLLLEVMKSHQAGLHSLSRLLAAGACDGFVMRSLDPDEAGLGGFVALGRPGVVIGQTEFEGLTSVAHDVAAMVTDGVACLASVGASRRYLIGRERRTRYHQRLLECWTRLDAGECLKWPEGPAAENPLDHLPWRDQGGWGILAPDEQIALQVARRAMREGVPSPPTVVLAPSRTAWVLDEPGMWRFETDLERVGRTAGELLRQQLNGGAPPRAHRLSPRLICPADGTEFRRDSRDTSPRLPAEPHP